MASKLTKSDEVTLRHTALGYAIDCGVGSDFVLPYAQAFFLFLRDGLIQPKKKGKA